jgi:hypothetical protein
MPTVKPYPHIYRNERHPSVDNQETSVGIRFIQAYQILKRDLVRLFEFIEPCPDNYSTYSQRTFEMLLRACTEVESNCKQVLRANGHATEDVNIIRFSDLNGPMKLSEYIVCCPAIDFEDFSPFKSFALTVRQDRSPSWYRAYNQAKHDRATFFSSASLRNVIEAMGAVHVLIWAQYGPIDNQIGWSSGIRAAPASYFSLRTSPSWSPDERYQFDWNALSSTSQPYDYHPVPQVP